MSQFIRRKKMPIVAVTVMLVYLMQVILVPISLAEAAETVTPRMGNQNLDVDIAPVTATIESGQTGEYKLSFKVTGSTTEYQNANLVVMLPSNARFTQPLSELVIAGVTPTYDESSMKLSYRFPTLTSGQAYSTIIRVVPDNGTTLNNTKLKATAEFSATGFAKVTETAEITVTSAVPVNINKSFAGVVGGETTTVPTVGTNGTWKIKVSIPKTQTGMLYLKPGSTITISDKLPSTLTFVSASDGGKVNNGTVSWQFTVPTLAEQAGMDDIFSKEVSLVTTFNNSCKPGTVITNTATVTATEYEQTSTFSKSGSDSVTIATNNGSDFVDTNGDNLVPLHFGPADAFGNISTTANPNPHVYDTATLRFGAGVAAMYSDSLTKEYDDYTITYTIDPDLNLERIYNPTYRFRPNSKTDLPLKNQPKMDIYISQNNGATWQKVVANAATDTWFELSDYGVPKGTHIDKVKLDYTYAPAGISGIRLYFDFSVKKGATGEVKNSIVYDANGYTKSGAKNHSVFNETSVSENRGPRTAQIDPTPVGKAPTARTTIRFDNALEGNTVTAGDNRITASLINDSSSIVRMKKPFQAMLLLPQGVKLKSDPKVKYTGATGITTTSGGSYVVVTDNYNGTGQQLVKVSWNDLELAPGQALSAGLDVSISGTAPPTLNMSVYGFSGDTALAATAPSNPSSITDSSAETDVDDLNGDGNKAQKRIKSGNTYNITNSVNVQTEKSVKGDLDTTYSSMGHASPGGVISYQLKLTNTNGVPIENMTLIDVLPSVGDLGITDNANRGSKFTPKLTGPIVLPAEWADKVEVSYSTAKNPKRDDLYKNVTYPTTTTKPQNPAGATDPAWVSESNVKNWGDIYSFKIAMKPGVKWVAGQNINIKINMKAPSYEEFTDKTLMDASVDETQRAAWNSFAFTANNLQAVEPARVGVVVNATSPSISKDVEGKQHHDLANRSDTFTWNVKATFGSTPSSWTQAELTDSVNSMLEIVDVEIVDENNANVENKGTLSTAGNVVSFKLKPDGNGKYTYLAGHTYTMKIKTKIKSSATDIELSPYMTAGGIPNQAELLFGKSSKILSESPTVSTPKVDPKIKKDVESKKHYDLKNKADVFTWNIETTFGNTTAAWSQAMISDKVNGLFDIVGVSVVDEKNVPVNGILSTANNNIEFKINSQNGGYAFLTGHTYTMKITAKLKSTATDAQLAPYIKDGGVPNQAVLTFGNPVQTVSSEIVTVSPPVVNPKINKTVEEEAQHHLENRNDPFSWEIKTTFGNTTASWTQAKISDQVNSVFDITGVTIVDETGRNALGDGVLTNTNNNVIFTLNQQAGSYAYLAGHTYTMTITAKIKDTVSDSELAPYMKDGGIPNQAELAYGNNNNVIQSDKPTVVPPKVTPTIHKEVAGKAQHNLSSRDESFDWHLQTTFGNTTALWSDAKITDHVSELLTITSVKVVNELGQDVSGNGTLNSNGNNINFTLKKQNGSYAYLAGHTYTMTITTKINSAVSESDLAPFVKTGIPNQGTFTYTDTSETGSRTITSEKPIVMPSTTPTSIHKNVEGSAQYTLNDLDKSFEWHINTTFGNTTTSWTTAKITDQVSNLLVVTDVKIVDEKGTNVTGNGTLTTTNNKVEFSLAQKQGSYAYLAGHTYKMTITTKVKQDLTDEQLATAIKDGGIPNQASLTSGNGSDVMVSEQPTVTFKETAPTIHKDVENKSTLDLIGLHDSFDWHIKATLGNTTASWNDAKITDQVNPLLDITNIKVVDEKGNDVTKSGQLTNVNNLVEFTFAKQNNSYAYLAGHTYTMTMTTKIKDSATNEQIATVIKAGGIPNQASLIYGNSGKTIQSETPTVKPPAVAPTLHKDVEGSSQFVLADRNDAFTWHVKASFGNTTAMWSTAKISDQVSDLFNIVSVKVTDANGDVTSNGTLTTKNNLVEFSLNPQNGSYAYLAGQTYDLAITAKIKPTVTEAELAPYVKNGGISNQANLAYGDGGTVIKSEKPTVVPPIIQPQIHKDVEGESKHTLTNRSDEFSWHVNTTFGNTTASWEEVKMTDKVNDALKITNVTVVDESGANVTDNGILSTKNNQVEFVLKPVAGSYNYLAGHTYTMTIKTKIKDSVTDVQLAPYIKDGVPNQAEFVFGDSGQAIYSEEPTVVAPSIAPEIHKDIEEMAQHQLENKGDTVSWHVNTTFGNTTATWAEATITDEVSNLLEITDVKVTNKAGDDVTNTGTLTTTNNKIEFKPNKQDNSYTYLAGETYTMTINTKLKSTTTEEMLAPVLKSGIANQAGFTYGSAGEAIQSEVPILFVPTITPEIHKDVAGKSQHELTNHNDAFTWNVTTKFGNTTSAWTKAVITDQVNPLFEIMSVKVFDENGIDVTSSGTLTTAGNNVNFVLPMQNGRYDYLAGHTYKMEITAKIAASTTDEQLAPFIKAGGVPNTAQFTYSDDGVLISETPMVTVPAVYPKMEKDINGKSQYSLLTRDESFNWNVKTSFGNTTASWTEAVITDDVNDVFEITDVAIVDENGTSVEDKGTLTTADNQVIFTMNEQNGSYAYLAGHTYTMTITTSIKDKAIVSDAQLAPYIKDGGIPNQAELAYGQAGNVAQSNTALVTPPSEKPAIDKDVEGKAHHNLSNRNDKFSWHITTTFGNTTALWSEAKMTDQVNDVFDIIDVTVTDASGNDVTTKGTLTTTDHLVSFVPEKQDGSYTYLAGQTYTMTIETKINDSVTDSELSPYITGGGIPNRADLTYGNGKTLHSGEPTVAPPTNAALIQKDVEGKTSYQLTERNETFDWHVTTTFGNTTAAWTEVKIIDEVNSLLDVTAKTIVDENNQPVAGTWVETGNHIEFLPDKVAGSYAYLSGHTYTMTITTKIKDTTTDEALAPFVKAGIPNKASLSNGSATAIETGSPAVLPPAQLPTLNKSAKGKPHLELTDRGEVFTWEVQTTFGNTTASWSDVKITDKVNSLLEITKITVLDENDTDVISNGTITPITDNNVIFALDKKSDSYAYLAGHTYTMKITAKIKDDVTEAELAPYIKDGGISNQAKLTVDGTVLPSNQPTVTVPAIAPTVSKDIENSDHYELANRDETFEWHVATTFGNTTASWKQAVLTDQVNSLLEVTDVTVEDGKGNDVTDNGTLTIEENQIEFTLDQKSDSYAYLAGQTYQMTIKTKLKTSITEEDLAPYIKDGGIPNQANLAFGNGGNSIESGKPTLVIPSKNPEISKDVEGKSHHTLKNRDDAFEWNVETSFGNTTASWNEAIITDDINPIFEITAITVVDEDNHNVTSNGVLTDLSNNQVQFTLNQKDGSYAYLAGHTYTMTITTKIKDSVTDEVLAPYIEDGGISNQAGLAYGHAGELIETGTPTVVPPSVNPTIVKKVNGETHYQLTNRGDDFSWTIETSFGNTTTSWTEAKISDQVNPVFAISSVTVIDQASGEDVTGSGTLSTSNNLAEFTPDQKDGSYTYLAGHTYVMTINANIKADITEEQLAPYIKAGGVPNQATLAFGHAGNVMESGEPKVAPPTIDPSIKKDINGQAQYDLKNRDEAFEWHVETAFGNTTASWTEAIITDQVNDLFEITEITVTDEAGNDVIDNGTMTPTTENNVEFALEKKNDSYAYLAGHTYKTTIKAKIKADVKDEELAPYIKDGGISNQAVLSFGDTGKPIESSKAVVTPPPVAPTINKDVQGSSQYQLVNQDEAFEWHVTTTFGNTTASWTKAAITDQINPLLEITDVTVVNESGTDMTDDGQLVTIDDNNLITFTPKEKDGSYTYLAGHTYTMTIKTKLEDDATDEVLAPYIKDGGIPNQAILHFGNDSTLLSGGATVTPPIVNPAIEKDIEGKAQYNLTGLDQTFDWHIEAAFGNTTASWTEAMITDEVNPLLEITKVIIVDENGADVSDKGTLTQENNQIIFSFNQEADSFTYLAGHTYKMTISTKLKADVTGEELAPYIKDGGISNQAELHFGDDGSVTQTGKPKVTLPSEEPTISKDIEGEAQYDLTNKKDSFDWHVVTTFGNTTASWTDAKIIDEVNPLLNITKVTVVDEFGNDVTDDGSLVSIQDNKVTFTPEPDELTGYTYLAGHTYTMTIKTALKSDVTDQVLAPFIQAGGISNQATLTFGANPHEIETGTPIVVFPVENPIISKDVEGAAKYEVTNRDQEFDWHVVTTFGNTTASWAGSTLVITDKINQLLTVTEIKIVDENNMDVTPNGTLAVDADNQVTFTLNEQAGSFDYLAGHTYTMTITTKLREDATDAEVAPYVTADGLTNQATLQFGEHESMIYTGKPAVVPPTVLPLISKQIEGQASYELSDRNEVVDWTIETSFGNATGNWSDAKLVDQVNEVLEITDVVVTNKEGDTVSSADNVSIVNNQVTFTPEKQSGSHAYLAGDIYSMTISTKIKGTATEADLAPYIKSGIPNQAKLVFGDGTAEVISGAPTLSIPATNPDIHKDIEGATHYELVNVDQAFNWQIETAFGNQSASWSDVKITDQINPLLEIMDVRVTDENGVNVTNQGVVTTDDNQVEFTPNKQAGSYTYLAGQTYTMTITTKIRATATDAELAPYMREGGIPNQALLVIDDSNAPIVSEVATVMPPITVPTVEKTIEGKPYYNLTNRDDIFNWKVKASFGNNPSWSEVKLVDQVNEVFDIVSVTVVDENGNDVSDNGTVSIVSNKAEFKVDKQSDTYDYLAGHTYTMTIATTIKDDVTETELAPYIAKGGIPNQASLSFGDSKEAIFSEEPTVMPPTDDPFMHKDAAGEMSYQIPSYDASFDWHVTTNFGNKTDQWASATITDEVNDLLEIEHITIVDENNQDVRSNGELIVSDNKVEFKLIEKAGTYNYLAGHTYTMTITTKIKNTVTSKELATAIEAGGIPNQAKLSTSDTDKIESETPVAIPLAPVEPEIVKTVEGNDHYDIVDRNEPFNWQVVASFGNTASIWNEAEISDQIDPMLEIVAVSIVDENGQDVSGNGTLSTTDNHVKFALNKQAGSYRYLAGHTYTMTIATKIKGSATDAELSTYRDAGGIQNQATFIFADGSKISSDTATATPPAKPIDPVDPIDPMKPVTPLVPSAKPELSPTPTAPKTGDETSTVMALISVLFATVVLWMARGRKNHI